MEKKVIERKREEGKGERKEKEKDVYFVAHSTSDIYGMYNKTLRICNVQIP
jgi:hypothetical protein